MNCVVCHSPTNFLSHKCEDGPVCNICYAKTPSVFRVKDFDAGVVNFLCRTYDEKNARMCREFRETCKIGNFHFDSEHLLGVIGKINKDGTIDEGNSDVFSLANLKSLSFTMLNAKALNEKKVTCDIQMNCTFNDTFWEIHEVVSKGEQCFGERNDKDGTIEFSLPAGVQIVWDDVIKYVNASRGKVTNAINETLVTEDDLMFYKARVLFMVDTNYTQEDIDEVYYKLKNAFLDDKERLSIVQQYKYILEDHLSLRMF